MINTQSIDNLLKNISEEDREIARKVCQDLYISESLAEPRENYLHATKDRPLDFFEVTIRRKGKEHIYTDIYEKTETISILKVLQWVKRDLSVTDNYQEFKNNWDIEMAKKIGNYRDFIKDKDPEMERIFKLLQERKVKLKEMFAQQEMDVIPPLTERY